MVIFSGNRGSLLGVNRAGRDVDPLTSISTQFSNQLSPLTAVQAVTAAAIPQTVGLPKMWGCQGDSAIESSVLEFAHQQIG